jgi:peroxiredoxin
MKKIYVVPVFVSLLFAALQPGWPQQVDTTSDELDHAIALYNNAHYSEAARNFAEVLNKPTDKFWVYSMLWEALSHTESLSEERVRVAKDIALLSKVSPSKRTEYFFSTYERGLHLLGEIDREKQSHIQQLKRFPRGVAAHSEMLDAIRRETNPRVKASLYGKYLNFFSANLAWTEVGEREQFLLIRDNPNVFSSDMLLSAAREWEHTEAEYAKKYKDPFAYILALQYISNALVTVSPASSLTYCDLGSAFIETQWRESQNLDETYRIQFWPIELRALVGMKQWPQAIRLGTKLVDYIESNPLPNGPVTSKEERSIRNYFAVALKMNGDLDQAFKQYGMAAELDSKSRNDLEQFLSEHPKFKDNFASSQKQWKGDIALEVPQRSENGRKELLATEQKQPSTPFTLTSLSGDTVSLSNFKGKPLVLNIWASWCPHCPAELDELNSLYESKDRALFSVLAISADTDKEAARSFWAKRKLSLPTAFADEGVEIAYQTETVPQTYIIDADGVIRFHIEGAMDDLTEKLGWMLQVASHKAASTASSQ